MGQSNFLLSEEYFLSVCVCRTDEAHFEKFKCVKAF